MGLLSAGAKTASAQAAQANEVQRQEIAKQEAVVARQEAGIAAQQTDLAKRAMAAARARRGGGLRSLLSGERTDAELGLPQRTTLGSGV
jgi:pimeloyl-CoA synthetase